MPDCFTIEEGEGVAGPVTQVWCRTTGLSSCSAIIFANSVKGLAGMYHYPAEKQHDNFVTNTIRAMFNHVEPERVWLQHAPDIGGMGASQADRAHLWALVTTFAVGFNAHVGRKKDYGYANYWWDAKERKVKTSRKMPGDHTPCGWPPEISGYRRNPWSSGRDFLGKASYFGSMSDKIVDGSGQTQEASIFDAGVIKDFGPVTGDFPDDIFD